MDLDELRFPEGKFDDKNKISRKNKKKWMKTIRRFPKKLEGVVKNMSDEQLDTPYRPEGWTVRQLVHHVADSHVNSYIRFRWAMTESTPTIKAYIQDRWAELDDAKNGPIKPSLQILKGIHRRWIGLLKSMTDADFEKELSHPEWKENLSLARMLSLYAWHCDHHMSHITNLIKRKGWDKKGK